MQNLLSPPLSSPLCATAEGARGEKKEKTTQREGQIQKKNEHQMQQNDTVIVYMSKWLRHQQQEQDKRKARTVNNFHENDWSQRGTRLTACTPTETKALCCTLR